MRFPLLFTPASLTKAGALAHFRIPRLIYSINSKLLTQCGIYRFAINQNLKRQ